MNNGTETEYAELKKSTSELKEGIQSIASMLNEYGKGTLYFGVKNNEEVVGQQIGDDTLNQISRDIAINIKPSFIYDVEEKYTPDTKFNYLDIT